jgi:hypothetical protein
MQSNKPLDEHSVSDSVQILETRPPSYHISCQLRRAGSTEYIHITITLERDIESVRKSC